MRPAIFIVTFAVLSLPCYSAIINVPKDYATIQEAIDAAAAGDTVLVAAGTYEENINFNGKAVTVRSSDGPESTVIDGKTFARSVVKFVTGEGPDSVLDGFTLKNGSGTSISGVGKCGGGICCEGTSPTITNNIIRENSVDRNGGGIYCRDSAAPLVSKNLITQNAAGFAGAGICCQVNSYPLISENIITGNCADNYVALSAGGGIGLSNSPATIVGNVISNNSVLGNDLNAGGGILCTGDDLSGTLIANNVFRDNTANFGGGVWSGNNAHPTIANNLFMGNSAVYRGGGIQVWNSLAPTTFTNNTLYGNSASESGGGIECNNNASMTVTNTILWNNDAPEGPEIAVEESGSLAVSYSDVEGGPSSVFVEAGSTLDWGTGMMDADPLFVDAAGDDLHLRYTSPCCQAGDNACPGIQTEDFEGDPRVCLGTVDMGADEFHRHLYFTGDASPGGLVALKFLGEPGTSPVGFWIAFDVLETPFSGGYGDWYLLPPMLGPVQMPAMPSDGVQVLAGSLPATPTGPYTLYLQAVMGTKLSNLCVMDVQ